MAKQRERKTKPGVYKQAVAGVLLILTLLSAYFAGLACITPRRYRVQRGNRRPLPSMPTRPWMTKAQRNPCGKAL